MRGPANRRSSEWLSFVANTRQGEALRPTGLASCRHPRRAFDPMIRKASMADSLSDSGRKAVGLTPLVWYLGSP